MPAAVPAADAEGIEVVPEAPKAPGAQGVPKAPEAPPAPVAKRGKKVAEAKKTKKVTMVPPPAPTVLPRKQVSPKTRGTKGAALAPAAAPQQAQAGVRVPDPRAGRSGRTRSPPKKFDPSNKSTY